MLDTALKSTQPLPQLCSCVPPGCCFLQQCADSERLACWCGWCKLLLLTETGARAVRPATRRLNDPAQANTHSATPTDSAAAWYSRTGAAKLPTAAVISLILAGVPDMVAGFSERLGRRGKIRGRRHAHVRALRCGCQRALGLAASTTCARPREPTRASGAAR